MPLVDAKLFSRRRHCLIENSVAVSNAIFSALAVLRASRVAAGQ